MKKRERRRYLTSRYQAKQMRYYDTFWNGSGWGNPYDPERKFQRESARKYRFLCFLKGDYIEPAWGYQSRYEPSATEKGRLRKHSWKGYGKCSCCLNPRKMGKGKRKSEWTKQERENYRQYCEQLEDENEQD